VSDVRRFSEECGGGLGRRTRACNGWQAGSRGLAESLNGKGRNDTDHAKHELQTQGRRYNQTEEK
jgi:hypothetical protein